MTQRLIRLAADVLTVAALAAISAIAGDAPAAPAITAADQQSFDKWKTELVKNRKQKFVPLNINYRVVAKWEPAEGNRTVDVPNVLDDVRPTPVSGTAVLELNGQEFRLTDLSDDPKTSLFFVFSDVTSKTDTYPRGRF